MPQLYLVDASIYVFRSYYSIPNHFLSRNGQMVNAVYGYMGFLLDLLDRKPPLISVAFDESLVSCYRNRIFPAYKANRALPDANLSYQLEKCKEVTGLLGLHHLCLADYEADDIIGTLLRRFGEGHQAVIVTRDKDLGQLLRADDVLWDFAADDYAGPGEVQQKFGVAVEQLADYLALAGDAVDNIPGAPGIGAKTAVALLNRFGTLEGLLANIDQVTDSGIRGAKKISKILSEYAPMLRIYRQITAIECDVPMTVTAAELELAPMDVAALTAFCDEMAFGARIRDRIGKLNHG